ncbi:MAG: tRNA preQ1(34) S-adenosylmethionine ribosyltransferase-isomerase QueA [Clostridiales bacterium]|jgi:S-adenosylmethionine:tRNA ribosyltransferase-isomerase|nr:tRNA preQ1(34) S-adenosylmethionine ribosyltransferase-isomerase QueA [Clostridiales bacterium]
MKTRDFYYHLPKELIAQAPPSDRSSSRLLVLNKRTGSVQHRKFTDIVDYLSPGDCLALNNTKVIPARLLGCKPTGARVEILLLERIDKDNWQALVKPGRRLRMGDTVIISDNLIARVTDVLEAGKRIIHFEYEGVFEQILHTLGEMPLPPYITQKLSDKNRYQTVYADKDGSVAAPTAGLHFTDALINSISAMGVNIAYLTLHVGLGTFLPVKTDNILDHKMHSECYEVSEEAARLINESRERGGKVFAVGTTSCRTLESVAKSADAQDDKSYSLSRTTYNQTIISPQSGRTNIFIYPGYKFQATDALITNFHLPESTLLMLVSALAGFDNIMAAYESAIARRYRFFSFGDAMLIIDQKE